MFNELNKKNIILGKKNIKKQYFEPFNILAINFLSDISKSILQDSKLKRYPDLITFAFWCRKSNLLKKSIYYKNQIIRKGLGLVLHVPPSNVPISFAYSFAFGILSGNSNIMRVSKPELENIKSLLSILKKIINEKKYKVFKDTNLFVTYDRNSNISNIISEQIDARVVWGGDETILDFKKMKTKVSCKDIMFFDKYSLSLIDLKTAKIDQKFIENFYNDTFIMDQNACSSPHLIFWKNFDLSKSKQFWKNLDEHVSKKYNFTKELKLLKYYKLNEILINSNEIDLKSQLQNISIYKIKSLRSDLTKYRGFAGIFFEYKFNNLKDLKDIFNRKYQTVTYYGIDKKVLREFLLKNSIAGIDRVVPVGRAIDMDIIWDGYDMISELSRIIEIK